MPSDFTLRPAAEDARGACIGIGASRQITWLRWSGAALLVVVAGIGAAVAGPKTGYLLCAAAALLLAILMLRLCGIGRPDPVVWMTLLLPVLLATLLRATGISLFGGWQAAIMLLSLAGLRGFWRELRTQALLRGFLGVFSAFYLFAAVSTIIGHSRWDAAAYQFVSNLKPLLAVVFGYALTWRGRTERQFWQVVYWFWLPALVFVALQWGAPSVYQSLFNTLGTADPTGIFPSRANGPFEHPSFLAAVAALFFLLLVGRILIGAERVRLHVSLAVIYLFLVVFAVQRQELASAVAATFVIFLLARPDRFKGRLLASVALGLVFGMLFWSVFADNLLREAGMWGIGTYSPLEHPRAQIFYGAFSLAHEHAPFGSGLGTFAGAGAEKFDTSLYESLGFRRYWWYGKEDFLMDTYWPNSVAETGFAGACSMLLAYLLLLLHAVRSALRTPGIAGKRAWAVTAAMMSYMLMLSFSSPAFQDLRLFLLPAMFFGISTRLANEQSDAAA